MTPQVIVYSLTGSTRRAADEIARLTGAGLSVIAAPRVQGGAFSLLRLSFATLTGRQTPVSLDRPIPADCDLAILAAPVWAGRVAQPMRSWLATGPALPLRIALVMTGGAPGTNNMALADFARRAGTTPVAQLYLREGSLRDGQATEAIGTFCAGLLVAQANPA